MAPALSVDYDQPETYESEADSPSVPLSKGKQVIRPTHARATSTKMLSAAELKALARASAEGKEAIQLQSWAATKVPVAECEEEPHESDGEDNPNLSDTSSIGEHETRIAEQSESEDEALEKIADDDGALVNAFAAERPSWVEDADTDPVNPNRKQDSFSVVRSRTTSMSSLSSGATSVPPSSQNDSDGSDFEVAQLPGTGDMSDVDSETEITVPYHQVVLTSQRSQRPTALVPNSRKNSAYVSKTSAVPNNVTTTTKKKPAGTVSQLKVSRPRKTKWTGLHTMEEALWDDNDDHKSDVMPKRGPNHGNSVVQGKKRIKAEVKAEDLGPQYANASNTQAVIDLTEDIEIVYPEKGGDVLLLSQQARLQEVIHAAIQQALYNVCFKDAFPEGLTKQTTYARQALVDSARTLGYEDIEQRLMEDKVYSRDLSAIPSQRVSNFRGKVKDKTNSHVQAAYDLQPGCEDVVRWLIKDLHYIYPSKPKKEKLVATEPFRHPCIIQTLRVAFFTGSKSFASKHQDSFKSAFPGRPQENEIPIPMLSLVSAGTFASLDDWTSGHSPTRPTNFTADSFANVYGENVLLLKSIQKEGPLQFHTLMHALYLLVCGERDSVKNTAVSRALTVVDVSGMATT
ncbi:hypothetical protein B0H21DRAFT_888907 [Amylocystis lapponica]|nr:hypothetical protein B0H21DRAFT_888907 [Amylocystis lapponica]